MKMKKILAVLLAVLLACGAFSAGSFAEGKNLFQYSVNPDGTAVITGITDEDIEVMEIPAELDGHPVTSIGDFAFGNCSNVISVTIPEGVTAIQSMAFGNCCRLESVSLPDSLEEIGWSAFRSERLTEIQVSPDHPVFAVENEALIDKNNMTLVRFLAPEITGTYEIAQGIRAIGAGAFELDGRLSSLVIPDSVTEIGSEAFAYCISLKEIVIPDSVVSIGQDAFYRCISLGSVTIPDSVTEIGPDIFDDCFSLTSINISPDHPVYEAVDLLLVKKADKEVISASGAIRGKYAVPEGILAIGDMAFQGCGYLTELFIPDTVTKIGYYAFDPNTVIRACAGSAAYRYCENDSEVRFTEITPEAYAEEVQKLAQEKAEGGPAEPVYGLWQEYRDIQVSGMYQYQVLQDGTAQITKADAFLTDGNIPAELDGHPVTSIGFDAFMGCDSLRSVVIPEGVVSLESYAFAFCDRLESVSLPDSLITMDRNPFDCCRKLKTVEVSPYHSVYAAARGALYNRLSLTLITVLDHEDTGTFTVAQGTRRIEESAFEGSRFSSVIFPDSVREIGSQAFSNCKNLTEIILPEGVTSIENQAFFGSEKLESVTFPDSLERISAGVFGFNKALTEVRISPDHPAYEMNGHLLVDKRTQEIVMALNHTPAVFEIPEGIRSIGDMAFQGSEGLTELIVPDGMTKIGMDAFSGCADLRAVTLPASLEEIGDRAFEYSRGLLIKAPAGSWAEKYARENGYRFEALSAGTDGSAAAESGLFEYRVKTDGSAEITKADRSITDGNIPAELDGHPVTSIGDDAFTDCESLQSVMIPEGVVSVGGDAFWNCSALESISIPDSLVSLEPGAFAFCRKLNTVEVSPDHPVLAVENKALVNRQDQMLLCVLDHEDTCTYTVTQGIRQIASFAFDGASFSSILLPGSLTSVRSLAFNDCGNLTEIILPEGVTELGHQAFYGSKKLESVTIPDSLTQIGMATFGHNPAMKFVRISPDHPAYEMNGPLLVDKRNQKIVATLNNTPSVYEIPEGIRSIGEMAFQGSSGLTELTVPEGVEKIGQSAFSGCADLHVITLPASLEEIGDRAFEYSRELLVRAPAGSWAEQYARENGYRFEALSAGTDGAVEEKQDLYRYRIKADGTAEITGIKDKNIETLEIPAELDGHSVTSIGDDAFMGCKNLQSAVIPEGVGSVGPNVFWNCPVLESVSIPDSLVSVEQGAFALCRKLKTVEVSPDHPVYAVENRALVNRQDQTLLRVLDHEDTGAYEVAQGIRQIAVLAFEGASFSSILLPDSLTSVRSLAFSDCPNLTGIVLPEGVTDIGSQAFVSCINLTSVTIPDSLIRIEKAIFSCDPALTDVRISPDHPAYEMNGPLLVDKRNQEIVSVLYNIPGTYEIPEGIKEIGPMAFQGSSALTELIVPEGVTQIGTYAFSVCVNLHTVTLPASLEEIGDYAFESTTDLLVKAPAGSRAEQYAREKGYRFEALPADGAD